MQGVSAPFGSRLVKSRDFDEYLLEIYVCDLGERYAHFLLRPSCSRGTAERVIADPHAFVAEAGFSVDHCGVFNEPPSIPC